MPIGHATATRGVPVGDWSWLGPPEHPARVGLGRMVTFTDVQAAVVTDRTTKSAEAAQ
jgi:hypothetical protein